MDSTTSFCRRFSYRRRLAIVTKRDRTWGQLARDFRQSRWSVVIALGA